MFDGVAAKKRRFRLNSWKRVSAKYAWTTRPHLDIRAVPWDEWLAGRTTIFGDVLRAEFLVDVIRSEPAQA